MPEPTEHLQHQNPDNAILQGGLGDPITTQTPAAGQIPEGGDPAHLTPPAGGEPAPAKVVFNGREFNSAAEALAYAEGLNRSQAAASSALGQPAAAPQAPAEPQPHELIFENPERALKLVEDRAAERIRNEQKQVEETKNRWNDFYTKHPDLRGKEFLVDSVLNRELARGTFNGMSVDQGMPILATKAREEVQKIVNAANGGQALPRGPAVVAGTTGGQAPKPPAPAAPKTTSFVEELQGMRKRG